MTIKRIGVFDPDAFYPFRSLVEGQVSNWKQLDDIERFVRALVLHDEMMMEIEPVSDDGSDNERDETGPRNVIVGFGPVLTNYKGLLSDHVGPKRERPFALSPAMLDLAAKLSNGNPGNPYYEAHVDYISALIEVWRNGGSVLCNGEVGRATEIAGTAFPSALFDTLDKEWQEYANAANVGKIGPAVPPVLAIILNRSRRREDIPLTIIELRDEWASAREKVWKLVEKLKSASTLKEANEVRRQLDEASNLMSPRQVEVGHSPLRALWELVTDAGQGSAEAVMSGGDPIIGAITAAFKGVAKVATGQGHELTRVLFRRGALDLASRVRQETSTIPTMIPLLSRFLTTSEMTKLGL